MTDAFDWINQYRSMSIDQPMLAYLGKISNGNILVQAHKNELELSDSLRFYCTACKQVKILDFRELYNKTVADLISVPAIIDWIKTHRHEVESVDCLACANPNSKLQLIHTCRECTPPAPKAVGVKAIERKLKVIK